MRGSLLPSATTPHPSPLPTAVGRGDWYLPRPATFGNGTVRYTALHKRRARLATRPPGLPYDLYCVGSCIGCSVATAATAFSAAFFVTTSGAFFRVRPSARFMSATYAAR